MEERNQRAALLVEMVVLIERPERLIHEDLEQLDQDTTGKQDADANHHARTELLDQGNKLKDAETQPGRGNVDGCLEAPFRERPEVCDPIPIPLKPPVPEIAIAQVDGR